jgi:subtilisin family serine protease
MHLPRIWAAVLAVALVVGFMPAAHADTTATYIVELKAGVSAQEVIPTLLGSDATILDKAISGGIATLTATQAKALESSPYVKSVRQDTQVSTSSGPAAKAKKSAGSVSASAVQTNAPWDLDILDSGNATLDGTYTAANDGSGVTVYVVDTGIYRASSQFANITVAAGYNYVTTDSPVRSASDTSDCDGQGTAVASLIAGSTLGASKGVTIVPLRVLDCVGRGSAADLVSALNYVLVNHVAGAPAVVDIGLGVAQTVVPELDTAVQNVIAAGITVVVAAEFQNVDAGLSSPGRVPAAITVAASNSSNGEATGTSWGSSIDLYAPGQDVSIADNTVPTSVATGSGTAYSAGIVAGIAAQVLHANPSWTPAQVSARVTGLATSGKITNARSVNKLASVSSTFDSFVKAAYQDFLGRQPSSSELAFQSNALSTGAASKAVFLSSLATSNEWLSAIVTKMYRDTLNRDPDPGGLANWVLWLRSGRFTVAQAASLFYSSNEYFTVAAGSSTSTWVQLLYQKLLNRTADASGLPFWVANTERYGKDWVAGNFYQSEETRMRRVRVIYETLLFREPDQVGLSFWTARVLTTGDLQLAWEVANSDEYWDKAHTRYPN